MQIGPGPGTTLAFYSHYGGCGYTVLQIGNLTVSHPSEDTRDEATPWPQRSVITQENESHTSFPSGRAGVSHASLVQLIVETDVVSKAFLVPSSGTLFFTFS